MLNSFPFTFLRSVIFFSGKRNFPSWWVSAEMVKSSVVFGNVGLLSFCFVFIAGFGFIMELAPSRSEKEEMSAVAGFGGIR